MIKLKDILLEDISERKTYIARSKITGAGKGLFAGQYFPMNTAVLVAPVTKIPDDQWELLKQHAPELLKRYGYSWGGAHMAVLGKNWPGFKLSPESKEAISQTILRDGFHEFNFINDNQNQPNVVDYFYKGSAIVITLKDVKKGEEFLKKYPPDGTATYNPDAFGGKYKNYDWLREKTKV